MRIKSLIITGLCAILISLLLMGCTHEKGNVLEEVKRTGKITIGHREGSIPFGFYDKAGNWVGFSLDLGERLVEELEKELNMDIKYIKKPVSRESIPFVANRTIDIVMGSTTHTISREDTVDFTITFFLSGSRLLVPKGSPIRDFEDLAGKKVGAALGSTNERALHNANAEGIISPACIIEKVEDHPQGFLALSEGKIDAYCTDGSLLAGMKQTAAASEDWEVVGRLLTYDPYAYIVPEDDSDWRDFVNTFLINLIKSGEFYEIYNKWMGPNGVVPIDITHEYKTLLELQCWPE